MGHGAVGLRKKMVITIAMENDMQDRRRENRLNIRKANTHEIMQSYFLNVIERDKWKSAENEEPLLTGAESTCHTGETLLK